MLYELRMTLSYAYGGPAVGGRHLLRLMPAEVPGVQKMILGALDIRPAPRERHDQRDFFGNRVTALAMAAAHDAVSFVLRARVERTAPPAGPDLSPPLGDLPAEIAACRDLGPEAPHHFLGASPRVLRDAAVGEHARAATRGAPTVLAAVAALNRALHADLRYDAEATTVETPLAEAFAARRGVCQDFSHIMIAGLRDLGIPAGYVSGFLRTEPPPGQPRLEGADAMHAWVRAWCGARTGWVEFDPTNAIRVGADHIVVGWGRDYSDVAPVKGVLWTNGPQTTKQGVDVIALG